MSRERHVTLIQTEGDNTRYLTCWMPSNKAVLNAEINGWIVSIIYPFERAKISDNGDVGGYKFFWNATKEVTARNFHTCGFLGDTIEKCLCLRKEYSDG